LTQETLPANEAPVISTCELCKITTTEEMVNQVFCPRCGERMEKAYGWLQKSLMNEKEKKALHKIMLDLTDVSKIRFEEESP
jgi:hypothetical protein